jgi:peptide/nickel transport system substrate-binding protein
MSRRIWLSVATFVLGASLFAAAGCGGGGSDEAAPETTPATTSGGGTQTAQKGGTLRANLADDTDYTDPALAYYSTSWNFLYSTCVKLLNYADKPAPEGSKLQPEAASSMPTVSQDGKTYTFTVPAGKFKFSPPSNEPLTVENFHAALLRDLNPKMQSPASSFMMDIAGAEAYASGKAQDVSGITVSGDKLTIKLTTVAPDFLSRIAMPFFCAIPKDMAINPKGEQTYASAGPYFISKYIPARTLVLERNPNYTGDRPHNLDKVVYTIGVNPKQGLLQVQKGTADWPADGVPPSAHSELSEKWGPDSENAKNGKQRYFVNPTLVFRYLALNTERPIFKDEKLRQAVAAAIDRPALIRQRGAFAGDPTDQYLPPGIPGYKDEEIYSTTGADVEQAKELAGTGEHGSAVMYTCNESPCPETAQIVQANLKQIGIDVEIKQFDRAVQFSKEGTKGEPFDIGFEGWQADYADPYDFINILLYGPNIGPKNNQNFSYFDDPTYNKRMADAAKLSGDERFDTYGQLDVDLAKGPAPLAAWANDNERSFFAERVGCQIYHPIYGEDIAQLCIEG